MANEHVITDCRTGNVTRVPLSQEEIDTRANRPRPTPADLAAQLDTITGGLDQTSLALRAVISLLADRMGVTDAQAKAAVKQRMQQVAAGERG